MELQFEISQQITTGNNPSAVHFEDETAQVFFIDNSGKMYGINTTIPSGEWNNREFSTPLLTATDNNMCFLTTRSIPRFGVYASWLSINLHRFSIYGVLPPAEPLKRFSYIMIMHPWWKEQADINVKFKRNEIMYLKHSTEALAPIKIKTNSIVPIDRNVTAKVRTKVR